MPAIMPPNGCGAGEGRSGSPTGSAMQESRRMGSDSSGGCGIGLIALDADLRRVPARPGSVVGGLYAHQGVHVHVKRLLDAQRHLAGEVGILIQEIRQRGARHAQHLCRRRDGEPSAPKPQKFPPLPEYLPYLKAIRQLHAGKCRISASMLMVRVMHFHMASLRQHGRPWVSEDWRGMACNSKSATDTETRRLPARH